jgi:mannose-6-phosphate isomerase-like protein (cupin superfamily)
MKHLRFEDVQGNDASAFGLKGGKQWTIKLLADNSIYNELAPGGHTPAEHIHEDSIERGVVLSGRGVIIHEGDRIELRPHDFIEIIGGNHQYVNTGNDPLVFVCFRFPR